MRTEYNSAKNFAKNNIKPFSKQVDEEQVFPKESFKAMGDEGYFKKMIPKEYGGEGFGIVEQAEICMAFAESSATAGLCYMMHNVALMCVVTHGSDELKKKIFTEIVEEKSFLALAYSEFGSGTHFYKPDLETKLNGQNTIFNGYKSMVTSANEAAYYLVLAPSKNKVDINNWLFPLHTKGLSFEMKEWHGLGMRGNASCPMKIDNVCLEENLMIGAEGSGLEQVFNVVAPFFITGLAAVYSGLALNMSSAANIHTTKRKYPDGSSLSQIETVQIHLANLYSKAFAAKSATFAAADAALMGDNDALGKILSARIIASDAAIECGRLGMRVGGGKSYNKENELERLLRDAYASQIMAPSADVLTIWLGKSITGQSIP